MDHRCVRVEPTMQYPSSTAFTRMKLEKTYFLAGENMLLNQRHHVLYELEIGWSLLITLDPAFLLPLRGLLGAWSQIEQPDVSKMR
jgi:hypothetical protein